MPDRIERAFGSGVDRGDADIDRIRASIRTRRKIPLRGTSGRSGAWLRVTHHIPLGTARRSHQPTLSRVLYKVCRAIIHDETGGGFGWVRQLVARWIDLRTIIDQRGVCHPQ